jgi:hypothetical protein
MYISDVAGPDYQAGVVSRTDPSATAGQVVRRVNQWVLMELTRLNQNILAGRCPRDDLGEELTRSVLADLPPPDRLSARQARQLVVLLGLTGASVGRHYQENNRAHVSTPERAFDPFVVGVDGIPFCTYFAMLADRTGTGHCHRDSYASLTRWNVATTEVRWAGQRLATLPGAFDDVLVRTYTGTPGERRFFELIKLSETIESAVNTVLTPLSNGTMDVGDGQVLYRVGLAVELMTHLRRLSLDFTALPPEEGLRPDYFLDVFRQYAVHWRLGDIPPTGALDPQAIARDYLLGAATPSYDAHIRRLYPALLDAEREELTRLVDRPSVPAVVLRSLGLDSATLADQSPDQLRRTVSRHPVLAALYLLLNSHARMSGVHLKIAKKYLFEPQRRREGAGLGDPNVVSNRAGTSGMGEPYLEELTRVRHRHALACMHKVAGNELEVIAGLDRVRADAPTGGGVPVRFLVPGGGGR